MRNAQLLPLLNGQRLARGGRRNADNPVKRSTQIRWIGLVLAGATSVKEAAYANRVSRRTILRWRVELISDDTEDTDVLRDLEESRRTG